MLPSLTGGIVYLSISNLISIGSSEGYDLRPHNPHNSPTINQPFTDNPAVAREAEAYGYASAEQATAGVVICIMDQANGVSQIREFL